MTNTTNRGLWLAAAASIAFAIGCGGNDKPDAGPGTCTTDAICGTGKGCHPVLKTCVNTCTGATDCPSNQKTCAKINDSSSTFCTCSTDALCAASNAGQICNRATSQCTAKCTATSCPSGFTCEMTSGQCTGTTMDAGMTMDAGVTCNIANQPDVCRYGNLCNANNVCEGIVNGTCFNVSARPVWNSSSTGPVIYRVDDVMPDNQAACTAGTNPFTTTVFAYAAPNSTFPTSESMLPGFFYYTTTGTRVDIPANLLTPANYRRFANDTVMSATFTLCSTATNSLVAGFGFTNGNGACVTLTR